MKKQKGFTLIELLVAITIMGVLVAIALVSFQGARRSARDGKRKADLEQVRATLEMCYADDGFDPVVSGQSFTCGTPPSVYGTIPADPSGYEYYYNRISDDEYALCAYLEGGGSAACGNTGTLALREGGPAGGDIEEDDFAVLLRHHLQLDADHQKEEQEDTMEES